MVFNKVILFFGKAIICGLFFFASLIFIQAEEDGAFMAKEATLLKENVSQENEFNFRNPFQDFLPLKEIKNDSVIVAEQVVKNVPKDEREDELDLSSFDVTGLVWGAQNPKAIINDQILGVGDEINEARIVNISKEGILFKYKDKKYLLERVNYVAGKDKK